MAKYKMLVLTNHGSHSAENSLYSLALSLRKAPECESLEVSSRSDPRNAAFFSGEATKLMAAKVKPDFAFDSEGRHIVSDAREVELSDYDLVFMRLPPPLGKPFLDFLENNFDKHRIINRPSGIWETGSKAFLLNFTKLCPPIKACRSLSDIKEFRSRFPIVLKPFRDYGGNGVVRLTGDQAMTNEGARPLESFYESLEGQPVEYLGMKFLKNVSRGDKRVNVINGKVAGWSLRMPARQGWLCNVAMGGRAVPCSLTKEEEQMAGELGAALRDRGVLVFGFDTLEDDSGLRVLSELNTASIGGLHQAEQLNGTPTVETTSRGLWDYVSERFG